MSIIKNIGRIRQISSTFAKHGFAELMDKLGFARFVPSRYRRGGDWEKIAPAQRLRMALEELGPTFIKLGQVLSSRSDLLPETYVEELVKLQDKVSPLPVSVIRHTIERELGKPVEEIFLDFQDTPLASASIGQVHSAKLKDGTPVVVKVQRPGLDTLIRLDVSILTGLAAAVEKYIPETKVLAPQVFVDEFFRAMTLELDYQVEANNICKAKENLKDFPGIYVPNVFLKYTTNKVLVTERLSGIKLDETAQLDRLGIDRKVLAENLAKSFLHCALNDGFFHGDLHPGNLFALPADSNSSIPRLGLIDFGIMGYLTRRARESLVRIFVALHQEDFETLCFEYMDLGKQFSGIDQESFQRALQGAIAPYIGLPLEKVNVGRLLLDATAIAARHKIRVPRDWMIVFKAIYTLEGSCRKLYPEFNAIPLLESFVNPLLQKKFSWNDLSREMVIGSRDTQYFLQAFPRQLQWFFKKLSANGYAIEWKDAEAELNRENNKESSRLLARALVASGCLISGAILMQIAYSYQSKPAKGMAVLLFLFATMQLWRFTKD